MKKIFMVFLMFSLVLSGVLFFLQKNTYKSEAIQINITSDWAEELALKSVESNAKEILSMQKKLEYQTAEFNLIRRKYSTSDGRESTKYNDLSQTARAEIKHSKDLLFESQQEYHNERQKVRAKKKAIRSKVEDAITEMESANIVLNYPKKVDVNVFWSSPTGHLTL